MVKKIVEIRCLSLKPGTRGEFHRRFEERALPLLRQWQIDVVAFGPSLHDDDTYHVIRAFDSLEQRQAIEDAYYGSADWREGPRGEMLALIERYVDVVIDMDAAAVDALRKNRQPSRP